ncbi:RNA polymerase sigma factor [Streptomyces sp. RS10V-4]|uniref:RNA polymerase sigma factor n=1 Tax=Streptomyces rhizoryzae TaxID=2932493 RepID=UPI002006ACAD|nr:RNA polymerase sigma factor [Streptomyces rhizoryzae]MCK7627374.1 RNA polymerase sigma factor [Streptomyces rhizoryzae]
MVRDGLPGEAAVLGGEVAQRLLDCYPDFMARQPLALRRQFPSLSLAACQDPAQEAFLRVGSKAADGGLAPETNVMAYLGRTARNLAVDRFRSERGNRLTSLVSGAFDAVPERREPTGEDRVLEDLVRPAIKELPASLRRKVVDLQSQGLDDAEIAAALGIPARRLHNLRNKAVAQLRSMLAGHIRDGHRKQQHGVRDR